MHLPCQFVLILIIGSIKHAVPLVVQRAPLPLQVCQGQSGTHLHRVLC